jgi:pentatricopeptide repeat protein
MYAKCGSMEAAVKVFKKMTSCDVVSGLPCIGHAKDVLGHFQQMCENGGGTKCYFCLESCQVVAM